MIAIKKKPKLKNAATVANILFAHRADGSEDA
jgi:hypothetical protein